MSDTEQPRRGGSRIKESAQEKKSSLRLDGKWLIALTVVVVLLLAVVGWFIFDGNGDGPVPGGYQLKQYPHPERSELVNNESKAAQVSLDTCTSNVESGEHDAGGMITNTSAQAQTYTITVYFMDGKTIVNFVDTTVTAQPGQPTPWADSKVFAVDHKLTCEIAAVS